MHLNLESLLGWTRSRPGVHRHVLSAVAVVALMLAVVPSARAALVEGSADDPIDDNAGLNDITHVLVDYDTGGTVRATVTFRDAPDPTSNEVVTVLLGSGISGQDCTYPGSGVQAPVTGGTVDWQRFDASGNQTGQGADGTATVHGDAVTLSVSDPGLAGQQIACAETATRGLDIIGDPYNLDTVSAFPVSPPAPKLSLLDTIPVELGRGESRTGTITVANSGNLAARQVSVQIHGSRGLTVSPARWQLATVTAGAVSSRRVRVKLAHHGRATATASVTVTGGGQRISQVTHVHRPPPALAAPAPGQLPGRYFWGTNIDLTQSWDNRGVVFVNADWAYRGFPPHGIPSCPAAGIAHGSGDGCVRYRYNPHTRRVNVGGENGSLTDGSLQLGTQGYAPLVIPRAGAVYDVSLLQQGYTGICPLSCVTYTDYLQLSADGAFSFGSQTIGTLGFPGGSFTSGSVLPPDQYGRYEVDRRGRLRLTFANGKVRTYTFAVQTNKRGRPDPHHSGLMLGGQNFYPPR